MKIAVLSDTHDNIWKIDSAMEQAGEAELFLHCGDLCSPFVIKYLASGASGRPVHVVWGNNDGDPRMIAEVARSHSNIELHGHFAELEVAGLKIALNHYPEIARALAEGGRYDLVCYGHDHTAYREKIGDTLLLNPGELLGMKGTSSFAWVESESLTVEHQEV